MKASHTTDVDLRWECASGATETCPRVLGASVLSLCAELGLHAMETQADQEIE